MRWCEQHRLCVRRNWLPNGGSPASLNYQRVQNLMAFAAVTDIESAQVERLKHTWLIRQFSSLQLPSALLLLRLLPPLRLPRRNLRKNLMMSYSCLTSNREGNPQLWLTNWLDRRWPFRHKNRINLRVFWKELKKHKLITFWSQNDLKLSP